MNIFHALVSIHIFMSAFGRGKVDLTGAIK